MVKHSQTAHVQIPMHKIHMFDMVNIGFCLWFFAVWFFAMRVCLKILGKPSNGLKSPH